MLLMHTCPKSAHRPRPTFEAELGPGKLSMTVGHFSDISENTFSESKWDVICGDMIIVQTTQVVRSASLWYVKRGTDAYQWVEVAYWSLNGAAPINKRPCFLPPGRDADYAAAPIMHNWNLAYQPRIISGANIEGFSDRWMDLFASAAEGKLSPPGRLPED
jgi:hypothetical protein